MIRKSDIQWWAVEAKKHPESAAAIIEELAQRLIELDALNEELREEIVRLQRGAPPTAESAEVDALRKRIASLENLLDGPVPTEPAVVFLSQRLQSARVSLSRARKLTRERRAPMGRKALVGLCRMLLAGPRDELLLLTSQGRGLKMMLPDVPPLADDGGWPGEGQELAPNERLTAATAAAAPPRFWTVVTRRGFARQYIHVGLDRMLVQGNQLIESPFRNDPPIALVNGDRGDLLLVTRWGKGERIPQLTIASEGSVVLELEPDDEVVAAIPLQDDGQVLIVTASGYGMRRATAQLEPRSRPGGAGRALVRAYDVLDGFVCKPEDRLLYLTVSGKLGLIAAADIPLHQRATKGTQLRDLGRDPAVAAVLIPGTL
jgi:DNA gyrase subunit A